MKKKSIKLIVDNKIFLYKNSSLTNSTNNNDIIIHNSNYIQNQNFKLVITYKSKYWITLHTNLIMKIAQQFSQEYDVTSYP